MMNERKTENIVRELLRGLGYYSSEDIIVEEQKSDDPKINKLLKLASKKGVGQGFPEFIIRSISHSDIIIIIECKADITKHESKDRDNYANFAVDGALLYASYIKNEYDVVAIGVSGQELKELKISHFLYLRNSSKCDSVFGGNLLSFDNYWNNVQKTPQKFNQNYSMLLKYSQDINTLLHRKKVLESERSLLISGILIALQNDAFRKSFKAHKKAKQITTNLIQTICNELTDSKIPSDKIKNLKQSFSFIETHTVLSKDKEFLEHLIEDIDNNINQFMKTYQYFDTLGQFYIEFLKYANNDGGLGIVLTPPHITDLFAEISNVHKDSIIVDSCCGTGGFLVSAMKIMVENAKGDEGKISDIINNQIIGVEFQSSIYALAVSNMIIHNDGKSNIILGDCFELVNKIRDKYKPNIGHLNPPYKVDKDDIEELEYVLNNIDMLEKNGTCVAIIPISCVLAQDGEKLELKKRILEKHTLEAVMSMPSELFHNSDKNVVTAIIVITAHQPHPKGKKTWFAYWRDDGFKITKKGRLDVDNRWNEIKKEWIDGWRNRDINPTKSIMKEVEASDEWCVEAYMETNYTKITEKDFEDSLKKYVAFKIVNR